MLQMEIRYRLMGQKDKIMKIERIPIYLLLMLTAVYMLFAKNTPFWNGLYFVTNYSIMAILFNECKDKWIKIIGCSLSISILIFSVLKFFISLNQNYLDILNVIIFIFIALAFYKLEPK